MSKSVVAFVTLTVVCGTASAYLWQELREERAQSQSLRTRVEQLEQAQIALAARGPERRTEPALPPPPAESSIEKSERATAEPRAASAPALTQSAVAFQTVDAREMPEGRQRRVRESMEQQRRMLQDPEYRALMRDQQKLSMQRMYRDLEMMMGLSKDDADKLREVLAEQQLRAMEHRPAIANVNGTPDPAAMRDQQRYFQEVQQKNEAELKAALGSKYDAWQEYQQSTGARWQVMQLRESLALSDEPLREDQLKPLVQAIAREQQQQQPMRGMAARFGSPRRFDMDEQLRMQEEHLERTKQSHERVRSAVSSLLTSTQLSQLEQQQDLERRSLELSVRQMRARAAEAAARGEDPTQAAGPGGWNALTIAN